MKALRLIGGAALAFFFLVAVAAGLLTPQGRSVLTLLRDAGTTTLGWAGDQLRTAGITGTIAGNGAAALAVGAGVFVLLMLVAPAARSSKGGVTASVFAAVLVGIIAYQPSLVGAPS